MMADTAAESPAAMHVQHLEFQTRGDTDPAEVAELVLGLLSAWRMSGQVCGREWPVHFEGTTCHTTVLTPGHDALQPQFHNRYVNQNLSRLHERGISAPRAVLTAPDPCGADLCTCASPGSYLLMTNFISLEPPVRCLDCMGTVPLYTLPARPDEDHHALICWQSDYKSCDALQMNCATLERAAIRQLSDVNSSLSRRGRDIGETLSGLTGKPFYYYLMRTHGRSLAAEKKRPCSSCGQPWYLESPRHSWLHFQCDHCHLLSNIGFNLG